jgi:hypothetical protein
MVFLLDGFGWGWFVELVAGLDRPIAGAVPERTADREIFRKSLNEKRFQM